VIPQVQSGWNRRLMVGTVSLSPLERSPKWTMFALRNADAFGGKRCRQPAVPHPMLRFRGHCFGQKGLQIWVGGKITVGWGHCHSILFKPRFKDVGHKTGPFHVNRRLPMEKASFKKKKKCIFDINTQKCKVT